MTPMADLNPPLSAVTDAVARALAEDVLPLGDLTAALVPATATGRLVVAARTDGIIAGQRCAEAAFALVGDGLSVVWHRPDGSSVAPGDVVAEVSGPLRLILTGERTALNFLGHLSGVASLTAQFVAAAHAVNEDVRILDTRKTTPGLRALEKAAVRAGGGHNHRASLSDAVLVKDNHLGAMSITEAVQRARDMWPGRLVEIECDRADQVEEAARAGAGAVLLDNMSTGRSELLCHLGSCGVPWSDLGRGIGQHQPRHRGGLRCLRRRSDLSGRPYSLCPGLGPGPRSC